jgi:hypothetical protein
MPTPAELRDNLLKEMIRLRRKMITWEWDEALDSEPDDIKKKAALAHVSIGNAVIKLQNAALKDIRDQLVANEPDLLKGTAALQAATSNIKQTKNVLDTVDKVLKTVLKIVSFASLL